MATCLSPLEYLQQLELQYDNKGQVKLPSKYRARCRIGRNGRVIIDRIPVSIFIFAFLNSI